ncbi:MAG TPA: DUF1801 domain-containing protein [Candidatus Dojkabacteria bacterium]|nr:DUF1801 domain-containing protein [Candidatus Dojkabacteria bacterium]
MAELKTKITDTNPIDFIKSIRDERVRADLLVLYDLMKSISKEDGKMWGKRMVGFGSYKYKYASGREGEWFIIGFAPGSTNLTIYNMCGYEWQKEILSKLGKYKLGKSCLYIKRIADIDIKVLEELLTQSYIYMKKGGEPKY